MTVGTTLTLVPSVSPENASNPELRWVSSDSTIASVYNGTITAISPGNANIMAITVDGGRIATCAVTVIPATIPATGITLNRTTATLTVGGNLTLTATVLPANATNRNVTWTSSNTAVATVNNSGVVTAVAPGQVTITVTTQDGNFTATSVITVSVAIPVTGITVAPATTSLQPGNSTRITANVLPFNASNRNVTWTSSNPSVAVVDSAGNVIAINWGWTTITATTEEGDFTATSHVLVGTPVTSITISPTTATINIIGATVALTANVLPANATNRDVTWTSNNPAVATVSDNGVVTAVTLGTATITATTNEGNRTATATINVVIRGCNASPLTFTLGTPYFATNETWIITGTDGRPNQEWSDAVRAPGCDKTTFTVGNSPNFNANCRNATNGFDGHYFTWCMVMRFANQLCPPAQGWRVPTRQDFIDLDMNLGGNGENRSATVNGFTTSQQLAWYIGATGSGTVAVNRGGIWGGSRFTGHATGLTIPTSNYWSQSETSATDALYLSISPGNIRPQSIRTKSNGFAVRCVR